MFALLAAVKAHNSGPACANESVRTGTRHQSRGATNYATAGSLKGRRGKFFPSQICICTPLSQLSERDVFPSDFRLSHFPSYLPAEVVLYEVGPEVEHGVEDVEREPGEEEDDGDEEDHDVGAASTTIRLRVLALHARKTKLYSSIVLSPSYIAYSNRRVIKVAVTSM